MRSFILAVMFASLIGCVGTGEVKVPDGKGGLDVYTTTYSHMGKENE